MGIFEFTLESTGGLFYRPEEGEEVRQKLFLSALGNVSFEGYDIHGETIRKIDMNIEILNVSKIMKMIMFDLLTNHDEHVMVMDAGEWTLTYMDQDGDMHICSGFMYNTEQYTKILQDNIPIENLMGFGE